MEKYDCKGISCLVISSLMQILLYNIALLFVLKNTGYGDVL